MRAALRAAMWAAWIVPLGVFAGSLDGAVGYWDTGEMQVVPWIFGIAHPTGFPVFTILAGAFAHLFAIGEPAWRIALFCAIAMSGAAWFVALTVLELAGDAPIACASAWLFAFGAVVWTRGTRAEVHALAVFFAVAALYAAVRWRMRAQSRALIAGGLALGLGIATHPIVALLLPAMLVAFFSRIRTVAFRTAALAACALVLGVSCYAYLPLRSAMVTAQRLDPTLALGEPPGNAFWDFDHPASLAGLSLMLSGQQFGAEGALARMIDPHVYLEHAPGYFDMVLHELTPFGVLLVLGGFFVLLRRDRWLAAALALAIAVPVAFAFGYTIEADIARYYLISFAILATLAGYAAAAIGRELPELRRPLTILMFALAAALVVVNRATFAQPASRGAQSVIQTVRNKTPDNAIVLAPWIFATPLAYGSYVERSLGRRTLQAAWLSDVAPRVPAWMQHRPVYIVGILAGSVPGYTIVKDPGSPDLYRVRKP